jgi:uncharacterized protein YgiM (DUF1202 family)
MILAAYTHRFVSTTAPSLIRCVAFLGILFSPVCGFSIEHPVFVTANAAPIMDAAAADAQVLGRAQKGTRLTATGRTSGDWLEIQAPAMVSGWVYSELIRDAQIAASSVKVRSGPGIGYPSLGTLTRGEAVVIRDRRGDWVEVKGQPALLVWIERAMVAEGAAVDLTAHAEPPVTPAPVAKPEPVPEAVETEDVVPKPKPPPAKPAKPAIVVKKPRPVVKPAPTSTHVRKPTSKPAYTGTPTVTYQPIKPVMPEPRTATAERRLQPSIQGRLLKSAPQGQPVIVSGVLRPLGPSLFQPAPYRLVDARDKGPALTLCYLTGAKLLPFLGRPVRVQGMKYWVSGSREPVIAVREISASRELTGTP